jgi:hypothetical protein
MKEGYIGHLPKSADENVYAIPGGESKGHADMCHIVSYCLHDLFQMVGCTIIKNNMNTKKY